MSENFFIYDYLEDFSKLVKPNKEIIKKIVDVKKIFLKIKKNKKKIIIFGNGGSAAIASHVSVDLTKNSKIRCVNFNEADLITCFSNDFGYEHWIEKAIEYYGDKGDAVIFVSSSGKSKNILNGCLAAKKKFIKIITFSGHSNRNPLSKFGDINFWASSKSYNYIECLHLIWLLTIVDLIIGKREYSSKLE